MSFLTINSGVSAFQPSSVGGTSTSELIFPALNPNFTVGGFSTTVPLALAVPNNGQYEQQLLKVNASGKMFLHATSPTVIFKMYNGASLTAASDGTALLTMSAKTLIGGGTWHPWTWQSVFQGDSSSGILQAISSSLWIDNATAGTITLTGIASGVNFGAGVGIIPEGYSKSYALNLIISCTQGVSDALNIVYCSQYVLES